jgi:hypothetical protein
MSLKLSFWRALNPCSQNSGIIYSLTPKKSKYRATEMMDVTITQSIENAFYNGRGIIAGIWRTFDVLMGDHYDLRIKGYGKKGVLDVLIFPLLARRLLADCFLPERKFAIVKNICAFIIGISLELLRGLCAIIVTLILLPIIIAVESGKHCIPPTKISFTPPNYKAGF